MISPRRSSWLFMPLIALLAMDQAFSQEANTAGMPMAGRLTIGLRSRVPPFSWPLPAHVIESDATRGPLGRAGYGGYMVRLCDAALSQMLVDREAYGDLSADDIHVYDIDLDRELKAGERIGDVMVAEAKTQAEAAKSGDDAAVSASPSDSPGQRRFAELGSRFDILCDPATIANDRRDFTVSAPVFLTGIGMLQREGETAAEAALKKAETDAEEKEQKKKDADAAADKGKDNQTEKRDAASEAPPKKSPYLIGVVSGTTAQRAGLQALIEAKELPARAAAILRYLRECTEARIADAEDKVCGPNNDLIHIYNNYEDAANAFCRERNPSYLVGDLEIIRTHVERIPGCGFTNGGATYTNDRYAVFGKPVGDDKERALLVAAFFRVLQQKLVFNPSILDKAYQDSFPGKTQSRKLQLFYWAMRGEPVP